MVESRRRSPVDAVMVGAGQRGFHVYGRLALQSQNLRFRAVVDPDPDRRQRFGEAHGIPATHRYVDVEAATALDDVDAWFIASPDREHARAAHAAIARGIPVFLEKPIATTIDDVVGLARAAGQAEVLVHVAHVLRYTGFFQALAATVASGAVGDIVAVDYRENVAAFHMAHSFVRGNWGRSAEASPMIVAKCCHDFDILTWIMSSPVVRLSSFGSLQHFTPAHAPAGATPRCTDGCPVTGCPFDARRIYLRPDVTGWPVHVVTDDVSPDGRLRALETGPYGRCVYTAGSDVVDQQVVAMELADGASMTLTMHGHSHEDERTIRLDGTRGTIRAVFGRRQVIDVIDHIGGAPQAVPFDSASTGHGGGDAGAVSAFLEAVTGGSSSATPLSESVESHMLAFAAEHARVTGTVVDMAEFRAAHRGAGIGA